MAISAVKNCIGRLANKKKYCRYVSAVITADISAVITAVISHGRTLQGLNVDSLTHLHVGVDARPLYGVLVPVHDHGPRHHRDVLQDLLLHLGQRGHVREVALDHYHHHHHHHHYHHPHLVLARHPARRVQVGDLTADEVGEDPHGLVGLVVLLDIMIIVIITIIIIIIITWKMVS